MVTGYEYRINGGASVDVGLVYETEVTGLSPGTTYGFEIRSYNNEGEFSEWSSVAYATTFGETLVLSEGRAILDSAGRAITTFTSGD